MESGEGCIRCWRTRSLWLGGAWSELVNINAPGRMGLEKLHLVVVYFGMFACVLKLASTVDCRLQSLVSLPNSTALCHYLCRTSFVQNRVSDGRILFI